MIYDLITAAFFTLACIFSYRRDGWAREETLRMESHEPVHQQPWPFWSKSWLRTKLYPPNHWRVRFALYDGWHLLGWLMYSCYILSAIASYNTPAAEANRLRLTMMLLAGWALAAWLYRICFNPKT